MLARFERGQRHTRLGAVALRRDPFELVLIDEQVDREAALREDADAQPGHPQIREVIERARVPLTVCGHVHWDAPVARHAGGQILNVDSRVIVLIPS